jgi:hypothetical protein
VAGYNAFMSQALIAIVSLLIGAALNEWIRRSYRIESYAATVFQKRLTIYEELWKRIYVWRPVADKVIEDTSLTAEQRHELISEAVLDICVFCDDNSLYLSEDVTFQCCAVFMGVEDIQAESQSNARKEKTETFYQQYRETLDIIRSEAGLTRMNRLFRSVTKAKHSTEMIEHFREVQREVQRKRRKRTVSKEG